MFHRLRITSALVFLGLIGVLFGALVLLPVLAQAPRHGWAAPDEPIHAQFLAPSQTGYMIDNEQPGFSITGTWASSVAGGVGGNFRSALADNDGQEVATWQPDLDEGNYQVQVHYWADSTPGTQRDDARYTVYCSDCGTDGVSSHVNQQRKANGTAAPGGADSGWYTLGRYHFERGSLGSVTLSDLTTTWGSGVSVVADAVRFLPEEVWVDPHYCGGSSCSNEGHVWGVTAFDNLQDGINAVAEGGTVWVNPARYVVGSSITITKGITLYGVSSLGQRPVITTTASTAIQVAASNVTVTGLEVAGSGSVYGIANGGPLLPWVIDIQNVHISNNLVHEFQRSIYFWTSKVDISNNQVYSSTEMGISVDTCYTGTLISGNVITGTMTAGEKGIEVDNDAGDMLVSGNRVTGCETGVRVWQDVATIIVQKVSLQGNVITGGRTGVVASRAGPTTWSPRTLLIGGAYTYSIPNSIYGNTDYELEVSSYTSPIDATRNSWGVCTQREIENQIYHNYDNPAVATVTYMPAVCVPYAVDVKASPLTMPADGLSGATITVTARDVLSQPVAVGTMIGVTATNGSLPYGVAEAEGAAVIVTGAGWGAPGVNPRAMGGGFMGSANPGDAIRWTFSAPAISLVYAKRPGGGDAEVYIDDPTTPVTIVNMLSAVPGAFEWQVEEIIDKALDPTVSHWIEVRVPAAPTGAICVDAFRSGGIVTSGGRITTTLRSGTAAGTAVVYGSVYAGKIVTDTSTNLNAYVLNTASVSFGAADVYVNKSASLTTIVPGQEVTYTITYGNNGPEIATNVLVTDTLPANFTRVRSDSTPNFEGPNPFSGGRWVWSVGSVAPGATGIITLVAKPGPTGWPVPTVVTNVAQIGCSVAETSGANNQGSAAVTVVPAAPASVVVEAVPTTLAADGAATAAITATVKDQYGNSVVDNTVVTFTTTLIGTGFLPSGTTPKYALTSGGVATATLRAGTHMGTTRVAAKAGMAENSVLVTLVPLEPYTVTMTANPTWIRVDPSGNTTTTLSIAVVDRNLNPVDGATVNLTTTSGSFVGSDANTLVVTTTQGVALAGLRSACTVTTATVTAAITTTGRPTTTVPVFFQAGLPMTVTSEAYPLLLRVCHGLNSVGEAVVTATVRDACGNPVEDGSEVSFRVVQGERGDMFPTLAWTVSGIATSTVRTKSYFLTERFLDVYIVSRRQSREVSWRQRINLEEGLAYSIDLSALPASLEVGHKPATIRALVSDCAGNAVQDSTAVTFTTDALGSVTPTVVATFGGVAQTTYYSGNTVGTAVVTATANGRFVTMTVPINPGPADRIDVVVTPSTILNCGGVAVARATVYDAYNNLVRDDTPVQFSPMYRYVSTAPLVAYTRQGVVTSTVTALNKRLATWPEQLEQIDVTSASARSSFQNLKIVPGVVNQVAVTADPGSIPINGDVNFRDVFIEARISDCGGTPVVDGTPVRLETDLGIFRNSGTRSYNTLSVGGVATATLTSQSDAGLATVVATAAGVSGTVGVNFTPGAPWFVVVEAIPPRIPADGRSTSRIVARVEDEYYNHVLEGITVTFVTDYSHFQESGTVSYTTTTNNEGFVYATLVADSVPRTASVRCIAYNDRQQYAYVMFEALPEFRYMYLPVIKKQ